VPFKKTFENQIFIACGRSPVLIRYVQQVYENEQPTKEDVNRKAIMDLQIRLELSISYETAF